MATTIRDAEPPLQLWLDVERPMLARPRRQRAIPQDAPVTAANRQMELRMVPPPVPVVPIPKVTPRPFLKPVSTAIVKSTSLLDDRPPFGVWLLDQGKRPGLIGELAKAVKLDRLFPKTGTIEEVRARFAAVGADGDAFMALEDAELEYDRLS